MPITPRKSENEEEFIGRCMSEEVPIYGTEQGYAICKSKFDMDNMTKLSSPQDRVASKFNSIRIKHTLIQKFEVGVPHFTRDGELYTGPTHKDASGRLMTGEVHNEDSEYLYHREDLEVQPMIDSSYPGEASITGSK
jgi:hypothetical protein